MFELDNLWLQALISGTALLLVVSQPKASINLRLSLALMGLIIWLMPLSLITSKLALPAVYIEIPTTLSAFQSEVSTPSVTKRRPKGFWSTSTVNQTFLIITILGALWFAIDLIRHLVMQRALKHNTNKVCLMDRSEIELLSNPSANQSSHHNNNVYDQAFISGWIKPKIYLSETVLNSQHFHSTILHEQTHKKFGDNWYLLVIQLIKRLFWWNPIVWLLSQQANILLEMRCDQTCVKQMGERYQSDLASCLLSHFQAMQQNKKILNRQTAFSGLFFHSNKQTLLRIKTLEKETPMKLKNLAITGTALLFVSSICLAKVGVIDLPEGKFEEPMTLNFNQIDVREALTIISEYNDTVIFTSSSLKNYRFDLSVKDASFEEVLIAMAEQSPQLISIKYKNNNLHISAKD